MDEKSLKSTVINIDIELGNLKQRLCILLSNTKIGVFGCENISPTNEKDIPKLEPSLRTITEKVEDMNGIISELESVCSNIRTSEIPVRN